MWCLTTWCSATNFVQIAQQSTDLWCLHIVQYGVHPPSWIFNEAIFTIQTFPINGIFYPFTKFGAKYRFPVEIWPKNKFQHGGRCRLQFSSGCDIGHVISVRVVFYYSAPYLVHVEQYLAELLRFPVFQYGFPMKWNFSIGRNFRDSMLQCIRIQNCVRKFLFPERNIATK